MLNRARRFVQVLFGEGTVTEADPDDLFNISTATVDLELSGYESVDRAGLCFNRIDSVDFDRVLEDIEGLLQTADLDTQTDSEVLDDDYGYTWVLLDDPIFDDLVTNVHVVADTLIEEGYENYLLCAVFAFDVEAADLELYWIYNFKRGQWYAFAPTGEGSRNDEVETEAADAMESHLELEADDSRQYPLWGIPF